MYLWDTLPVGGVTNVEGSLMLNVSSTAPTLLVRTVTDVTSMNNKCLIFIFRSSMMRDEKKKNDVGFAKKEMQYMHLSPWLVTTLLLISVFAIGSYSVENLVVFHK